MESNCNQCINTDKYTKEQNTLNNKIDNLP